jgi:hypothetical protein
MSVFVNTQAYAQFILYRVEKAETDYEVMFFDESIKQKLNRSRMKFTKEPTPFLSETRYKLSSKVSAVHFDTDDLPNSIYFFM